MDRPALVDRAVGAGTSVGVHLAVLIAALLPVRHALREAQVTIPSGITRTEVFFVDRLPEPALPGLKPEEFAPSPGAPGAPVRVGAFSFDLDKIGSRATLLFPFLTPGLSLERFGLAPARRDDASLRMPAAFAQAAQPKSDLLKPPLVLGPAGVQALVDRTWSRRDRWRAFQPLAQFAEKYNPNTGQLAMVLRQYAEQNGLQPYLDPRIERVAVRDPRMWTELQIAADHVDYIGFISKFATEHPSTRATTELLFLLDKLVMANRDALVTMLDTDPWTDLEWTRRSSLDAVTFIAELQRHVNTVVVRKKVLGRAAQGLFYDDLRLEILKGIIRTTPDGYRASDAHFLMGSIYWRQGRKTDALRTWQEVRTSPDNQYVRQNADIEAALKALSNRPAAFDREIERILDADSGRWMSDSIDRLKRFGLRMDQY